MIYNAFLKYAITLNVRCSVPGKCTG